MAKIGEQKTRLSEKLQQRQEQELAEVETLTKASLTRLSVHLTQHVNDELNTTQTAITQQSEQIIRLLGAQQQALKQQQETIDGLKQLSKTDQDLIHGCLLEKLTKAQEGAILASIEPLRQVMARLESQGRALNRMTFRSWVKPLLLSLAICLGMAGGVAGGMNWLKNEISQQRQVLADLEQEIRAAEVTLERLPKGVTFIREGKGNYIVAK